MCVMFVSIVTYATVSPLQYIYCILASTQNLLNYDEYLIITYELCRRLMLNAHVEWLHILSIDIVHVNASCKRQWLNVMVNLSHMLMQVEINPAEVIISGINKQTNEPTTSIINHTIS